jgi:hypothetical protein
MIEIHGNKIDNIVAFGCSYTAGSELLDYKIHPEADNIKKEKGLVYWKENYLNDDTGVKYRYEEQKLAWAGQVANELGLKFTGKAMGGSSLIWSVLELEKFILSGEITPSTLVLFGATSKERALYFFERPRYQPTKSILLASPQWWPNPKWDPKTVLDLYNDGTLILNHIMCLERLIQLSEQLNGRLKIFEVVRTLKFDEIDCKFSQSYKELFQHKYNVVCQHENYYADKNLHELCSSRSDEHGGNHPKIHIHKLFADYVISKLICTT